MRLSFTGIDLKAASENYQSRQALGIQNKLADIADLFFVKIADIAD
jgi:hypothetical protein